MSLRHPVGLFANVCMSLCKCLWVSLRIYYRKRNPELVRLRFQFQFRWPFPVSGTCCTHWNIVHVHVHSTDESARSNTHMCMNRRQPTHVCINRQVCINIIYKQTHIYEQYVQRDTRVETVSHEYVWKRVCPLPRVGMVLHTGTTAKELLLQHATANHYCNTLPQHTVATHCRNTLCNTPLQHTTATHYRNTLPQHTTATLHRNTPPQHTTVIYYCNKPPQPTTATHNCNTLPQHTTATHHRNTPPQHTIATIHRNTPPQHTSTTLPRNTLAQHTSG